MRASRARQLVAIVTMALAGCSDGEVWGAESGADRLVVVRGN